MRLPCPRRCCVLRVGSVRVNECSGRLPTLVTFASVCARFPPRTRTEGEVRWSCLLLRCCATGCWRSRRLRAGFFIVLLGNMCMVLALSTAVSIHNISVRGQKPTPVVVRNIKTACVACAAWAVVSVLAGEHRPYASFCHTSGPLWIVIVQGVIAGVCGLVAVYFLLSAARVLFRANTVRGVCLLLLSWSRMVVVAGGGGDADRGSCAFCSSFPRR